MIQGFLVFQDGFPVISFTEEFVTPGNAGGEGFEDAGIALLGAGTIEFLLHFFEEGNVVFGAQFDRFFELVDGQGVVLGLHGRSRGFAMTDRQAVVDFDQVGLQFLAEIQVRFGYDRILFAFEPVEFFERFEIAELGGSPVFGVAGRLGVIDEGFDGFSLRNRQPRARSPGRGNADIPSAIAPPGCSAAVRAGGRDSVWHR